MNRKHHHTLRGIENRRHLSEARRRRGRCGRGGAAEKPQQHVRAPLALRGVWRRWLLAAAAETAAADPEWCQLVGGDGNERAAEQLGHGLAAVLNDTGLMGLKNGVR